MNFCYHDISNKKRHITKYWVTEDWQ